MEKISKLIKIFGYLDYAVSISVLAYGLYTQSWLYGAVGVFGLVVAYLQPAERVKSLLLKKFIRKSGAAPAPQALDSQADLPTNLVPTLPMLYVPRRRYARTAYFVGYEVDRPRPRMQASNARDYAALLSVPQGRFRPGIKAEKIVPR